MVYLKIKRLIDIILSSFGLIILSPVFLVLIIAIKLDSPGPVLFKQKRVGIHKSHFHILKFRTMRIDTPKDTPTHLLKNPDQWITKVGKFLRKTSLDELPQIINIFKGEMRQGDSKEIKHYMLCIYRNINQYTVVRQAFFIFRASLSHGYAKEIILET